MTAMMPGWQLPFTSELQKGMGELRAALLTTFEPPDADVLVEDVLPVWLGLAREATDSGPEQTTFIVELQQRIKALRGRLSVFTSTRPSEGSAHWLWNDVRLCTRRRHAARCSTRESVVAPPWSRKRWQCQRDTRDCRQLNEPDAVCSPRPNPSRLASDCAARAAPRRPA